MILDLGRAAHYQRPYDDPRVHAYVNDARAFLRATRRRYDVIVLGTLDSQTLVSGISLALVLLVAVAMVQWGAGSAFSARFEGPMFFLGAGFLLLETKSVSEMSLLFGATWVVNLLVFASILIVMLAANLVALLGPRPALRTLFVGLLLSLGIAFAVPVRDLLELGPTGQWVSGAALVGLPVFFAAWIFAILFRDHPAPARALAYNILGATVGGILEYSSLALGIKALYLVAAVMYLAAWLFYRGRLVGLRALSRHA